MWMAAGIRCSQGVVGAACILVCRLQRQQLRHNAFMGQRRAQEHTKRQDVGILRSDEWHRRYNSVDLLTVGGDGMGDVQYIVHNACQVKAVAKRGESMPGCAQ